MPKPKLAVVLVASMGLVLAVDAALALGLAFGHKPYVIPLISMTACIPGLVIAALAWQGRLPSKCKASR
jgi:hypothetical protein